MLFTNTMSCTDRIAAIDAKLAPLNEQVQRLTCARSAILDKASKAKKDGDAFRATLKAEHAKVVNAARNAKAELVALQAVFDVEPTDELLARIDEASATVVALEREAAIEPKLSPTKREIACGEELAAVEAEIGKVEVEVSALRALRDEQREVAIRRYHRLCRKRQEREAFETAQAAKAELAALQAKAEEAERLKAEADAAKKRDFDARKAAKRAEKAARTIEIVQRPARVLVEVTAEQVRVAREQVRATEHAYHAVRNTNAVARKHYTSICEAAQRRTDELCRDLVEGAGAVVTPSFEEVERLFELEAAKRLKAMHEARADLVELEAAWKSQAIASPVAETVVEGTIDEMQQLIAADVLAHPEDYQPKPGDIRTVATVERDGIRFFHARGAYIRKQNLTVYRDDVVRIGQQTLTNLVASFAR